MDCLGRRIILRLKILKISEDPIYLGSTPIRPHDDDFILETLFEDTQPGSSPLEESALQLVLMDDVVLCLM